MPQRVAASMALLAFAICLIAGGLQARNSFTTTAGRALVAMGVTFVVGLALGWMAQRMLDEKRKTEEEKKTHSPDNK
jgi:hypothetical protein